MSSDEAKYVTDYIVENDAQKIKWLKALFKSLGDYVLQPCFFKEMVDMDKAVAPCSSHDGPGGNCAVPSNDATPLKICGWSCVDFSKLSSNRPQAEVMFVEGRGKSGVTFHAFIDNLAAHGGEAVIGENLDDISKITGEVRAHVMSEFSKIGWVANVAKVESANHGSRTLRVRAYLIALNPAALGISKDDARTQISLMFKTRERLTCPTVDLAEVTLACDDQYLKTLPTEAQPPKEKDTFQWKKNLDALLEAVPSMNWSHITELIEADTTGTFKRLPEREQSQLAYLKLCHPDVFGYEVGQGPGRNSLYNDGCVGTITKKMKLVFNNPLRLATGFDLLLLQGMPASSFEVPESE